MAWTILMKFYGFIVVSIPNNMATTILIKSGGFIVHSKPGSMTLSAFSEKMHEIRKLYKLREDK